MRVRLFLVWITPVLMVALCIGLGWLLLQHLDDKINLPLLAIAGVILLIGVLSLVAVGFKLVGLADPTEALGLPQGSVRGVIALSLVVLFAILTVFLFSALNSSKQVTIAACLTATERNDMLRSLGAQQTVGSLPSKLTETGVPCPPRPKQTAEVKSQPTTTATPVMPPGVGAASARSSWWSWCVLCWWSSSQEPTGGAAPATPPNTSGSSPAASTAVSTAPPAADATAAEETLYAVYTREGANQASTDFAKQLLVLIGTLVTSVASFYFGAKSVADAQATSTRGSGPPTMHSVDPTTLRGGDGLASLTISGENLNDVKQVRLEHGDDRINGTDVMSNVTKVTAKVTIDAKAPPGAWDVVVIDGSGRSSSLKGAVNIP